MNYPKDGGSLILQQENVPDVRQSELSSLHSEMIIINEKSHALIMQINESLNKIHPINEPSKAEAIPDKPEEPSLVSDMKRQLRFARENSERLSGIARHLNALI